MEAILFFLFNLLLLLESYNLNFSKYTFVFKEDFQDDNHIESYTKEYNFSFPVSFEDSANPYQIFLSQCDKYQLSPNSCKAAKSYIMNSIKQAESQTDSVYNQPVFKLKQVRSFDIFGTLVVRDVVDQRELFQIIEIEFPFPNFCELRMAAEQVLSSESVGIAEQELTLDAIYDQLQQSLSYKMDNITRDKLMEFEINAEIRHSYLIDQCYKLVRPGDVLTADTYLDFAAVMRVLRGIGFEKEVNVFVSARGKSSGGLWEVLTKLYDITSHLGSDEVADVEQAFNHGVNGELSPVIAGFSPAEKYLYDLSITSADYNESGGDRAQQSTEDSGSARCNSCKKLALLFRRFRHLNPYPLHSLQSELYLDQVLYNLPTLLLAVSRLQIVVQKEGYERVLFQTREGHLAQMLFVFLYPEIEAITFHFSSMILVNPSKEFKDYVRGVYLPGKTIIFDLVACTCRQRQLFLDLFGEEPRMLVVLKSQFVPDIDSITSFITVEFKSYDDCASLGRVDTFNYHIIGGLERVYRDADGVFQFVRGPISCYLREDALIYIETMKQFLSFIDKESLPNGLLFDSDGLEAVTAAAITDMDGTINSRYNYPRRIMSSLSQVNIGELLYRIISPVMSPDCTSHLLYNRIFNFITNYGLKFCENVELSVLCEKTSFSPSKSIAWCREDYAQIIAEMLSPYYEKEINLIYFAKFDKEQDSSGAVLDNYANNFYANDSLIGNVLSLYLGSHLVTRQFLLYSISDTSEETSSLTIDYLSRQPEKVLDIKKDTVILESLYCDDSLWSLFALYLHLLSQREMPPIEKGESAFYILLLQCHNVQQQRLALSHLSANDNSNLIGTDLPAALRTFFERSEGFISSDLSVRVSCEDNHLCFVLFYK